MGRRIKLDRDPYDNGFNLYKKRTVEFQTGVTVLVGCNGIGKTSLLDNIKRVLRKENVPCITFDNLQDGGANARSEMAFYGNFEFVGASMCSSEGESIVMNLGRMASKIGNFIRNNPNEKELWILFDAIDSGLSIDNIVDVKELLFKTILEDTNNINKDIYIVVSANSYEMANSENCLDIYGMKYKTFKTYNNYRKFILKSKELKEKRETI